MSVAQWLVKLGEPLLPYGRHVPFAVQCRVIELAAARLFAAPLAEGAFDLLQERWLRLEASDLGLAWCLSCQGTQLRVAQREAVDVCIRGTWRDFLLLASRQEDPDTLFFRRRLVIEGDTDLGLGVKNLLDGLDPDQLPPRLWRLVRELGAAVH
ncbi:ubiquinone anaerobic biosynthesis accessory factor UbiT [Aquipseudomonas alcaligenes]|uniref:Ubiquinone biosynthesis accessory factor UbiT n=1 Tax=Aquipseudomonas alcaligenes TaxID=43263 RepID=A0AA37CC67_AQUAC|nr:SCP2 sterol-binding domain-containing protein [Pseudomonas alcaligenes]BCR23872.1 SCP2 domain-containing protein [Pseudomonas alcaligenes]GIZ65323.1 SCP2 domain-containing protein [Pseudomonas alcaligenes]GIZ69352.1 SCP2 domain-containing protein [Pseudomonas alcaligenes]GIZ73704.1 SCP2 domain-containing protein [Pseudomonas alcaligenes]GIZ78065.1 SCP2 domain-containing protein [Pseudomonas alcaligenes]